MVDSGPLCVCLCVCVFLLMCCFVLLFPFFPCVGKPQATKHSRFAIKVWRTLGGTRPESKKTAFRTKTSLSEASIFSRERGEEGGGERVDGGWGGPGKPVAHPNARPV